MKHLLACGAIGMLSGIAMNQLLSLLMSYMLNLGYYAPCFTWLSEYFGGELNAATIQMLCAALLGMVVSIVIGLIGHGIKKTLTDLKVSLRPSAPVCYAGNNRAANQKQGQVSAILKVQQPHILKRAK
ncbi:MAG: hypothetical protein ACI4ME_04335 [Aristaeellaceae bacterium]